MTRTQAFQLAFANARADLCLTRDKGSVIPRPPVTRRRIPRWRMTADALRQPNISEFAKGA